MFHHGDKNFNKLLDPRYLNENSHFWSAKGEKPGPPVMRGTESLFKQITVLAWKCCFINLHLGNTLNHVCFEKTAK